MLSTVTPTPASLSSMIARCLLSAARHSTRSASALCPIYVVGDLDDRDLYRSQCAGDHWHSYDPARQCRSQILPVRSRLLPHDIEGLRAPFYFRTQFIFSRNQPVELAWIHRRQRQRRQDVWVSVACRRTSCRPWTETVLPISTSIDAIFEPVPTMPCGLVPYASMRVICRQP